MAQVEIPDLREGYADLGEVRLHYVEAGEGPLVVLLHGFPEFWYGWRHQIPALAEAGFRVVAPDMRGYNLSSKPAGVAAYDVDPLARDVRDLIVERGSERAFLAGHDWGAVVAWFTAMNHGEVVERLAILNVHHPRRFLEEGLRSPRQLAKSWFRFFFSLPWLPERYLRSRDWCWFRQQLRAAARPDAFGAEEIERYVEAWEQPGALTGGLNYYRAVFRQTPRRSAARIRTVEAPTLVIWGERDPYSVAELAEPHRSDVPNLDRVVRFPEATHWVQHDEPEKVSALLAGFFGPTSEGRPV